MNFRPAAASRIFAGALIAALTFISAPSNPLESGLFVSLAVAAETPPRGEAGQMAPRRSTSPAYSLPKVYLGGTKATGRVAELYIKVAENVLLSANHAPEHLRTSGELWVDIEFPELLANEIGSVRAVLHRSEARVEVGDVVEIKFAHDDNPRYFPVNEVTSVAGLVAKKDDVLAKSYQRRILARQQQVPARLDWLAQALSLASGAGNAPSTIAASVSR